MNTRRTPYRREEVKVPNNIIPPHGEQVLIVDKKDVNEVVPPPNHEGPQFP